MRPASFVRSPSYFVRWAAYYVLRTAFVAIASIAVLGMSALTVDQVLVWLR